MTRRKYLLAGAAAAALMSVAYGASGAAAAPAVDLGPASSFAENAVVTVTVGLKLRNADQIDSLIESVYTRGAPEYHQFLTTEQFRERFAPTAASIAAITKEFESQGLKVEQTSTAQLHVSGSAAAIEKAFGVQLHSYAVAATASSPSYRYRAPVSAPQVPAAIASSVKSVLGLDTRPRAAPRLRQAALPKPKGGGGDAPNTPDAPGLWTVQDFDIYYNVNPIYKHGIDGHGRTLAIVTLASFTPSDAFAYWGALGLNVASDRITEVQIDGGSGAPSDASGSLETTVDVEQSGGIAPGAKILVYEAPNTSQGFVDAFAAAIDSNRAETISTSWGEWEAFDGPDVNVGNGNVTDPVNGRQTTILKAYNDLFAQAALQGQTMFAASGDNGAYDSTDLPLSLFNPVLSVDSPASEPYIVAAGGTTLPGTQSFSNGSTVTIRQEQAWGWDYLIPLCTSLGYTPVSCGIYPAGSGGGVSVYFRQPFYQSGMDGLARSVPGQTLVYTDPPNPPQDLITLPAHFAGRNVPDLSLNADPDTGYQVYYTSDVTGYGIQTGWGGTSFVAPQLNGLTSLYSEALHQRVGLLNAPLYFIARFTNAYNGRNAPLRDITKGDNWYWYADRGYDQTTGVGVPDAANLLEALQDLE